MLFSGEAFALPANKLFVHRAKKRNVLEERNTLGLKNN